MVTYYTVGAVLAAIAALYVGIALRAASIPWRVPVVVMLISGAAVLLVSAVRA